MLLEELDELVNRGLTLVGDDGACNRDYRNNKFFRIGQLSQINSENDAHIELTLVAEVKIECLVLVELLIFEILELLHNVYNTVDGDNSLVTLNLQRYLSGTILEDLLEESGVSAVRIDAVLQAGSLNIIYSTVSQCIASSLYTLVPGGNLNVCVVIIRVSTLDIVALGSFPNVELALFCIRCLDELICIGGDVQECIYADCGGISCCVSFSKGSEQHCLAQSDRHCYSSCSHSFQK